MPAESGVPAGANIVAIRAWPDGLDALGNWPAYNEYESAGGWVLRQTRTHNAANDITDIAKTAGADWIDPVHDLAGNLQTGPKPGAETTRHHYVYDAWNRLVKVYADTGGTTLDPACDTLLATYHYDGLHRRIRKAVNGGHTYDYYYNTAWQLLEVHEDSDTTNPYEQLVWDARYIDAPAVRFWDHDTDGSVDETHYFCTDANMNVTALVTSAGTIVERYVYDPYGKVTIYDDDDWSDTISWSAGKKNPILYCGYYYDDESGLYHVRHRPYHPSLGRWTVRDFAGYLDGLGLYAYVQSQPAACTDPTGLRKEPKAGDAAWTKEQVLQILCCCAPEVVDNINRRNLKIYRADEMKRALKVWTRGIVRSCG